MYDLRQMIQDYLKFNDTQLNYLFKNFPRYKIHLALSATQKQFGDMEDRQEDKTSYFKSKLLSK